MTPSEVRRDLRVVTTWLDRPRTARRIPSPDEAYAAGKRLLTQVDPEALSQPLPSPLTAHALRRALIEGGLL